MLNIAAEVDEITLERACGSIHCKVSVWILKCIKFSLPGVELRVGSPELRGMETRFVNSQARTTCNIRLFIAIVQ